MVLEQVSSTQDIPQSTSNPLSRPRTAQSTKTPRNVRAIQDILAQATQGEISSLIRVL